jgi:hypothetical protein
MGPSLQFLIIVSHLLIAKAYGLLAHGLMYRCRKEAKRGEATGRKERAETHCTKEGINLTGRVLHEAGIARRAARSRTPPGLRKQIVAGKLRFWAFST